MPNLHDVNKKENLDKLTADEQKGLIDRIHVLLYDSDINDWESSFLESVLRRVESGKDLTEKQYKKLDQIEIDLPLREDSFYSGSEYKKFGEEVIF